MFKSTTPFESTTFKKVYLFGSVIIWISILFGSALILSGTPYFGQLIPVLAGGAVWSILLVPSAYFWRHSETNRPLPTE